jgi:peptidylprolyl isomerase
MIVGVKEILMFIIISVALIGGLAYLGTLSTDREPELVTNEQGEVEEFDGPLSADTIELQELTEEAMEVSNETNPIAVFTTNQGVFEIELFADQMPITTGNFIKLAEEGFYNGTKFHRIIQGFMIQGGDPNSKGDDPMTYGTGSPGYTIQDEFVAGDELTNVRGTIAMANTGQPNSGGSQFFINTVDNTNLDFDKQPLTSKHPVFGKVVAGMDIVDAIEKVETGMRDVPVEAVVVESVIIRTE